MILLLAGITLVTLDFRNVGPVDDLRGGLRDAIDPLRSVSSAVFDPLGRAWDRLFHYGELESENRELRQRVAELEGEALRGDADSRTLERLLAEVDIPYATDVPRVVARVVRGATGNFDPYRIEIDKGSGAGLAPGMAVVTGAGLIGILDEVDRSTAMVRLITDPDVAIGARLAESGEVGLVEGTGDDEVLDLVLVAPDTEVGDGEVVVTAGEAGGSEYPPDVPIGRARRAGEGEESRPVVDLAADLGQLDFVNVLVYEAPDPLEGIMRPTPPTSVAPVPTPEPSTTVPPPTVPSTTTTSTTAPAPVGAAPSAGSGEVP